MKEIIFKDLCTGKQRRKENETLNNTFTDLQKSSIYRIDWIIDNQLQKYTKHRSDF